MNHIDEIEESICSAIRSVAIDTLKGDGEWTIAIFKAIAVLGESRGYQICSSRSNKEYDGGWLFDLIWYKNNSQGQLECVPLVLESEWNRDYSHIKYDFEKLLIARSRYKVIIFQAKGDKMLDYFKKLQEAIEAFHTASIEESYIFVCFDEKNWIFQIRIVRVEKSIHMTKVFEVSLRPTPVT
jgi:hypothetical protein